jgi:membrane protein YdbS with pleckstrin-like domain
MSEAITLRPSPKYQYQQWAVIVCVFVFLILPFILLGFVPELGLLYVLVFMFANLLWLAPAMILVPVYYRSIEYQLTERDLVARRGIVIRAEDVVPYTMITNIAVRRGPFERLLGLGTLHVHTAGFSQQAGAEARIVGLAEWDRVHSDLLERVHRHQRQGGPGALTGVEVEAMGAEVGAEAATALLAEILSELRQLRSELGESGD